MAIDLYGVVLNSENTLASITSHISPGTSPKGSVSGTIQYFSQGKLRKYKFTSTSPVSVKKIGNDPNRIIAKFNRVVLKDSVTGKINPNCQLALTATKVNGNTWSGSFSIKNPNEINIRIHGTFGGAYANVPALKNLKIQTQQTIAKSVNDPKITVIVQVKKNSGISTADKNRLGRALGINIKYGYPTINAFAAEVNDKQLLALAKNDSVDIIWKDKLCKASLDISTPAVDAPVLWRYGYDGRGIGIAILDTGIYPHRDLTTPTNRILAFVDYVNNRTAPYDDNGHGTHVAGDAAGNGAMSGGRYRGPAPRANLIGVKVLNKNGSGLYSWILAGIQWVLNNKAKYNIRVLNCSLGGRPTQSYKYDPICQALEKLWKAGVFVSVAAGNSGPNYGTIQSPGIDPLICTVGADDTKRTVSYSDDTIAQFSSRGPTIDRFAKPDVIAPGVNIISLRSPGSSADVGSPRSRVGSYYFIMSGTSMATPICSGVAAQIMQAYPWIWPSAVKNALKATAWDLPKYPGQLAEGKGLIDSLGAIVSV